MNPNIIGNLGWFGGNALIIWNRFPFNSEFVAFNSQKHRFGISFICFFHSSGQNSIISIWLAAIQSIILSPWLFSSHYRIYKNFLVLYLSAASGSIVKCSYPNFSNLFMSYGSIVSKFKLLNTSAKFIGYLLIIAVFKDYIDLFLSVLIVSSSNSFAALRGKVNIY